MSEQEDSKYLSLESKYRALLLATARLSQRAAKRHRSVKDLERSVLYLRSLYNQVAPKTPKKESGAGADPDLDHATEIEDECGWS